MNQNLGALFTWDETPKYASHVKEHGISQFLRIWDGAKDKRRRVPLTRYIGYVIVSFDDEEENAKLFFRQTETLDELNKSIVKLKAGASDSMMIPTFHAEFAQYMLQSTPGFPYTGSIQDLLSVDNMRCRRLFVRRHLNANEVPITITSLFGCLGYLTEPYFSPDKLSYSLYVPEETISQNARYLRGSKVATHIPIFIHKGTLLSFVDPTLSRECSSCSESAGEAYFKPIGSWIFVDPYLNV